MVIGKRKTALMAGFIGNVVEWYDFALYGYMAGIIAGLFFPEQSKTAGLIATYGIFAAGFLMRPLGSAVFGWLGDTIGRSRTMMISVIMMVVPTVFLGALPTHETIGIWAPVLLVIIRLVQGLSVGGEFSSSVTYLVETAEDGRRGYAGSWANTGSMVGLLLGAGAAASITGLLSADAVTSWGWRIPFLLGGLIGGVAIFLRRKLPQSQHFKRHDRKRPETSPLVQAFTTNRLEMIQAFLFASAYGVMFYIPLVYVPEWLHDQTGMARHLTLQINMGGTALLLLLIPLSGWLGDRLIRRTYFIATAMLCLTILAFPLYLWLLGGGIWGAIIVQATMMFILAVPLGSAPAMFVELFPAADRLSGYSVSFNLGLGVVGGATPMFATWLIHVSGFTIAPAGMLVGASLLAFAVMLWIKDRSREPLR